VLTLAITVYVTVLVAELAGDKTLYTVGSLATSHRTAAVLVGAGAAVAVKMLAAVLLGGVIGRLPPIAVSVVSAATFVALAASLWLRRPRAPDAAAPPPSWSRGAREAFLGVVLTEWADLGQITAAALVAEHGHPALVWAFASLAMSTKVVLAAAFGTGFRRLVPDRLLRPAMMGAYLLLALLAAFRVGA
jgi:putative Ca2+/H+ antiporter (TMEM165/GDT1 family)